MCSFLLSQELAASADGYSCAVRAQRTGRGPVSSTDALPARLAVQQLSSLAGMSNKVRLAILHSQRLFERQAEMVERAVLQRCLLAWRGLHNARALKRERAEHLQRQLERGLLRRCLLAWHQQAASRNHRAVQLLAARAQSALARGLLVRCLREWRRLAQLRWWKTQLALRDRQLAELAAELRHTEARPVLYLRRFRLRRLMAAWRAWMEQKQAAATVRRAAAAHALHALLERAVLTWRLHCVWRADDRASLQRVRRWLARRSMQVALAAWRQQVGNHALCVLANAAAEEMAARHLLHKGFGSWHYVSQFSAAKAEAAERGRLRSLAWTLRGWRQWTALDAAREALLREMHAAGASRLLIRTLLAWRAYVDGRKQRAIEEQSCKLMAEVQRLTTEAALLRQDNERLARIIDSGDWGRERVAELLQAGEVLQRERDALLRLVDSLQAGAGGGRSSSKEAARVDATNSAAQGSGGGCGDSPRLGPLLAAGGDAGSNAGPRPALHGADSVSRNKLLVATGSSFNAMVRALKQVRIEAEQV